MKAEQRIVKVTTVSGVTTASVENKGQGYSEPVGTKFGKWTVIGYEKKWNNGGQKDGWWETYLTCECDCGTVKAISKSNLRRARTTGCKYCDKHNKTHGKSTHKLHAIWQAMKQRCRNPNHEYFENYGARGIDVCDEWYDSFEVFYEWCVSNGWEKGLQLDRRENNENYSPDNCRFITQAVNLRNKGKKIESGCGYLGVSKIVNKHSVKYRAVVTFVGRSYRLGNYLTAEEAAIARDNFIKVCGIPMHLNFDDENFSIALAESDLNVEECWRKADAEVVRIKLSRPLDQVRLNRTLYYSTRS